MRLEQKGTPPQTLADPAPPRYGASPLPPYRYQPGRHPHPRRAPGGHSFGRPEPECSPLDARAWRSSQPWIRAADLYNGGWFWEAHEQWEALWHAHGRQGVLAELMKGLIQTAAAHVKDREGNERGVRSLAGKSHEILEGVRREMGPVVLGLDLDRFLERHRAWFDRGPDAPFPWVELRECRSR